MIEEDYNKDDVIDNQDDNGGDDYDKMMKLCKFYKGWLKKIKEDEKPPVEEEKPVKKRFKISHDKNIS